MGKQDSIFWASLSLFCSNAVHTSTACLQITIQGYLIEELFQVSSRVLRKQECIYSGWPPRKRRKQHNASRYISKLELLRNNFFLVLRADTILRSAMYDLSPYRIYYKFQFFCPKWSKSKVFCSFSKRSKNVFCYIAYLLETIGKPLRNFKWSFLLFFSRRSKQPFELANLLRLFEKEQEGTKELKFVVTLAFTVLSALPQFSRFFSPALQRVLWKGRSHHPLTSLSPLRSYSTFNKPWHRSRIGMPILLVDRNAVCEDCEARVSWHP